MAGACRAVSELINFIVPGKPVGKGRPRFGRGRAYTPKTTVEYEKLIADCARQVFGSQEPTEMPCRMQIDAFFPIPKSWPKYKREAVEKGCGGYRPGKPDIDNVAKAVLDALNGIIYKDDSQVWELGVSKRYGNPALLVTIIVDN